MKKKIYSLVILLATALLTQAANNASFNWFLAGGGSTGNDKSVDVATDADGNIFLASYFLKGARFNGDSITGSQTVVNTLYQNNMLISKLSPEKTTLWSIYSNDGIVTPTALATTPDGSLILTATIKAITNTANQTTTAQLVDAVGTVSNFTGLSKSYTQSFVAKYNSNGELQWLKELNSGADKAKNVTTNSLACDASGNVYLTANFAATIIFPASTPDTLTSTNTSSAAVIAKLDGTTGDLVWAKTSSGGIKSENITALAYGDDGYLYAAGIFINIATPATLTIGDKSFTPSTGTDVTLIRMDTNGDVSYIQNRTNTTLTVGGVKDVLAKNGKVFICGYFKGTIEIPDGTNLAAYSTSQNGYILAMDATTGADLWQKTETAAKGEADALCIGSDGNLYSLGVYFNKYSPLVIDIDFSNGFTFTDPSNVNGNGDMFLTSYNVSTGVVEEAHKVIQSTAADVATGLVVFGDELYLAGYTNGKPATFEDASTYSALGTSTSVSDFLLLDYTVTSPTTAITPHDDAKSPTAYADNANHRLVVANAEYVKYVELYDTTGRIISSAANSGSSLTIGTQGIAPGVYIVKFATTNGSTTSQRVIIR
ncbi:MAG: hypothetical protein H6Q14_2762 [Bacteroidetes bacterium]|nr:hypothetical protein [Bacteroidota bacterium]